MAKRSKDDSQYVDFNDYSKITVSAKTEEQKGFLKNISENKITFVKGYPGSGKTYLSVAYALQQLFRKKFERIVFTRPVIEAAGEKLGFLPGDMAEKIDPYMIPIFSSALDMIDGALLKKLTTKNGHDAIIQVLPLAYMRGYTFKNTIVVCDEMQNSTPEQVRMLLTRIGLGSKMILAGDIKQSDIDKVNGLSDAFELLYGVPEIGFVTTTEKSVCRDPIITAIEDRYDNRELYQKPRTKKTYNRQISV